MTDESSLMMLFVFWRYLVPYTGCQSLMISVLEFHDTFIHHRSMHYNAQKGIANQHVRGWMKIVYTIAGNTGSHKDNRVTCKHYIPAQ